MEEISFAKCPYNDGTRAVGLPAIQFQKIMNISNASIKSSFSNLNTFQ